MTPDTHEFLLRGMKQGKKVIMTSNHDPEKLHGLIEHFDITRFIAKAYTSTEIGFEKPHPDFFRSILQRENLDPGEYVMVGNNPINDISGAEAVGMHAVLYDQQQKFRDFKGFRVDRLSDVWNVISSVAVDMPRTP